jgi:hypothetical protein
VIPPWGIAYTPARYDGNSVPVIYLLFAGIALARLHLITTPVPDLIIAIAMWVITAYLLLSVLPNLASKSIREKRLILTPVVGLMSRATAPFDRSRGKSGVQK